MATINRKNDIQVIAREFYADRSDKNFTRLYEQLYNLAYKVSMDILKDHDDVVDNINNCFAKIYENTKYEFNNDKKYVNYFMVLVHNEAIQLYNKSRIKNLKEDEFTGMGANRRFINESMMLSDDGEESNDGVFQMLLHKNYGEEELEINDTIPFFEDASATATKIDSMIDSMFIDGVQDAEIMRKLLLEDASVSKIATAYGFNSRVTITSRKRRGLDKLRKVLDAEKRFEQVLDGYSGITGTIRKSHQGVVELEGQVVDSKLDGVIRYYKNGELFVESEYSHGKKDGSYKKYINSKLVLKGQYEDGEQVGIWVVQGIEVDVDSTTSNTGILDLMASLLKV